MGLSSSAFPIWGWENNFGHLGSQCVPFHHLLELLACPSWGPCPLVVSFDGKGSLHLWVAPPMGLAPLHGSFHVVIWGLWPDLSPHTYLVQHRSELQFPWHTYVALEGDQLSLVGQNTHEGWPGEPGNHPHTTPVC